MNEAGIGDKSVEGVPSASEAGSRQRPATPPAEEPAWQTQRSTSWGTSPSSSVGIEAPGATTTTTPRGGREGRPGGRAELRLKLQPLYQIWQHRSLGETYAVRVLWSREMHRYEPRGMAGPFESLSPSISYDELATLRYEKGTGLQDLIARREEFTIHLPF